MLVTKAAEKSGPAAELPRVAPTELAVGAMGVGEAPPLSVAVRCKGLERGAVCRRRRLVLSCRETRGW